MNAVKVSTGIVSLIGTILFVYSFFAKAEEVESLKAYTEYSFDEIKLERVEDKINTIQVKPEIKREAWEKEKLLMLQAQHQRIIRRIEHNEK